MKRYNVLIYMVVGLNFVGCSKLNISTPPSDVPPSGQAPRSDTHQLPTDTTSSGNSGNKGTFNIADYSRAITVPVGRICRAVTPSGPVSIRPINESLYGLYKADDLNVGLADGQIVNSWPNSTTASQKGGSLASETGNQNTVHLKKSALSSHSAVVFGSSTSQTGRLSLGADYNVRSDLAYAWVFAKRLEGYGGSSPVFRGNWGGGTVAFGLYFDWANATNNVISIFGNKTTTARNVDFDAGPQVLVLNIKDNCPTSDVLVRSNGVDKLRQTGVTANYSNGPGSLTVVGNFGGQANVVFELVEMRAYSRSFSDQELLSVEQQLMDAYQISPTSPGPVATPSSAPSPNPSSSPVP